MKEYSNRGGNSGVSEYDVYFCDILLGRINEKTREFIKIKKALQVDENCVTSDVFCGTLNQKVLPMC